MTHPAGPIQDHFYVPVLGGESAFVAVASAQPESRRDCGVVLCPPFGWEELASHRALLLWARELADAGYAAARVSYPGTGDSSGRPDDPDRLQAWVASVASTAAWLRQREELSQVIAIGVGFGGLIAQLAASGSGELAGTVLWATPRRGRDFLRGLRAFSRFELSEAFAGMPDPPPLPEGALEAGGFLVSAQTAAALSAVDLTQGAIGDGLALGVLAVGADRRPPDPALVASLVERGIDVTVADGAGYAAFTSHPQDAELSTEIVARVRGWLDERSSPAPASPDRQRAAAVERNELSLVDDGRPVVERPIVIDTGHAVLSGVLTEPDGEGDRAPLCAVLVNAGAIHRIGPNRMWVEMARRWAASGVASLRLDLEAIGESGGADRGYVDTARLHDPRLVDQIVAAMDELQRREVAERFVVVGLCSGAYWALHLVTRDPRVAAAQLLNLTVVEWDEGLAPTRSLRAISWRSLVNLRRADTRARLRTTLRWVAGQLRERLRRSRAEAGPSLRLRVEQRLERLRTCGVPVLMLFCANEPLDADLTRDGLMEDLEDAANVSVTRIPVTSHTLRPLHAQERTREILDAHLHSLLADRRSAPDELTGSKIRTTPKQRPGGSRTALSGPGPMDKT